MNSVWTFQKLAYLNSFARLWLVYTSLQSIENRCDAIVFSTRPSFHRIRNRHRNNSSMVHFFSPSSTIDIAKERCFGGFDSMEQKGIVCFFVINCVPVRSLYNFKRKTNPPWEKGMNPYRIIRHNSDSPQKKTQESDAIINTQIERERWRNCSVYIQIPRRKKVVYEITSKSRKANIYFFGLPLFVSHSFVLILAQNCHVHNLKRYFFFHLQTKSK